MKKSLWDTLIWLYGRMKHLRPSPQNPHLVVQTYHSQMIRSVAFSPDGRTLASGSADETIKLWDVVAGRELRTLTECDGVVTSVSFSSDGRTLLSASNAIRQWDVAGGRGLASAARTITLWNDAVAREQSALTGHSVSPNVIVAFSLDGRIAASAHEASEVKSDKTIKFWDVASGRVLRNLTGPDGVRCLAFSHDGHTLASGHWDNTVKLWDASTGADLHTLGHSQQVLCLAFSEDGRIIAGADARYNIKLWDVATGGDLRINMTGPTGRPVEALAFSPDGHILASGSRDNNIMLWDVASGSNLGVLKGHKKNVDSVAFSPDGRTLASASWDETIKLWDMASGLELQTLTGHTAPIDRIAISPDGHTLAWASLDYRVKLGDLASGREMCTLQPPDAGRIPDIVAFSPNGHTLILAWSGMHPVGTSAPWGMGMSLMEVGTNEIEFWDVGSRCKLRTLVGRKGDVESVAFSPDGCTLASGITDGTITLWDVDSGQTLRTLEGHTGIVCSVAFSPDGCTLASGSGDNAIKLWDVGSGRELHTLIGHANVAHSVAFSPDGCTLASGSTDGTIKIWAVTTGHELRTLGGHEGLVQSVAFSPDGHFLASKSYENPVKLWDVASGRELRTLPGTTGMVESVAFTPDGRLWAARYPANAVGLWEADGREVASLFPVDQSDWIVSDPEGRFDTSSLNKIEGFSWMFPDDPLRALAPEIFMRDYYEPRLLHRLVAGEKFRSLPALATLNRVQPVVEFSKVEWKDEAQGIAQVTVEVSRKSDLTVPNGKTSTDVYDLRLFRDGKLVGWAPQTSVEWQSQPPPAGSNANELDLQQWREKTRVELDADGSKRLSFPVQVPRRPDLKQVTFTAYAFNADRVKSVTATAPMKIERPMTLRQGNTYLISIGVNRTQSSPAWDLHYAANDAREMSDVAGDKLEETKQFAKVVRIRLVSDQAGKEQPREAAATKAHVRAVLDVLAGRHTWNEQLKKEIPGIDEMEKAQPEDLVLLVFSSHGYTDDRGVFHMVLADITQDKITPELQRESLSSDELSGWLREVDAGELVMVVDSCHSAATVEAEGFKPGPMGSRGLGQMAYDKGMRILAACKSEQSAVERDGIKHGLLCYSLADEGLKQGLADFQPRDGKILMSEWLAYGEQEVPKLFHEGESKGMIQRKGSPNGTSDGYHGAKQTPKEFQQPVLFDFSKNQDDVVLSAEGKEPVSQMDESRSA